MSFEVSFSANALKLNLFRLPEFVDHTDLPRQSSGYGPPSSGGSGWGPGTIPARSGSLPSTRGTLWDRRSLLSALRSSLLRCFWARAFSFSRFWIVGFERFAKSVLQERGFS